MSYEEEDTCLRSRNVGQGVEEKPRQKIWNVSAQVRIPYNLCPLSTFQNVCRSDFFTCPAAASSLELVHNCHKRNSRLEEEKKLQTRVVHNCQKNSAVVHNCQKRITKKGKRDKKK
jgi:hypothetical protein